MKVLLLGGGGREHALAWKLSQSPRLERLFCAGGNPGTALHAQNVEVSPVDPAQVAAFAREQRVDLVVVGPEAPLVAGVADTLSAAGIPTFGPVAAAAALEGSKAFAKEVMSKAGIFTARYEVFDKAPEAAARRAAQWGRVVVKADGLAAGKGVIVATDPKQAEAAVHELSQLAGAGDRLVLEEVLEGEEVSVIALCDGSRFLLLPPARDHKRLRDNDLGPNTGGMGVFAPAPSLNEEALQSIGQTVIAPALKELSRRGLPFRGALYAGLMLTAEGPRVLEFNCRLGDPEAQVLMLQVEEDLLPVLHACAEGKLAQERLQLSSEASVGVVLASEGYPQQPVAGDAIEGLEQASATGALVFQAGTRQDGPVLRTAGGRVLTVCARGADLGAARAAAYQAVEKIRFRGMQLRRDIASTAPGS